MNDYPCFTSEPPLNMLLRRRREELNLRQADVAESLNVTPEAVTLWEGGHRRMELCKIRASPEHSRSIPRNFAPRPCRSITQHSFKRCSALGPQHPRASARLHNPVTRFVVRPIPPPRGTGRNRCWQPGQARLKLPAVPPHRKMPRAGAPAPARGPARDPSVCSQSSGGTGILTRAAALYRRSSSIAPPRRSFRRLAGRTLRRRRGAVNSRSGHGDQPRRSCRSDSRPAPS